MSVDFGNMNPFADRTMLVLMIVYLVMLGFALIFAAAVYVLQSLGIYTIAKRRCIHHSWLAWVPVANMWVLGSISDQYQFVAKGKIRNRRKVLLGLLIGVYVFMAAFFVMFLTSALNGNLTMEIPGSFAFAATVSGSMIVYMIAWVLSVIATVFMYIAYYNLFASCSPNNAVLFLVLSIFFNILLPIFVFVCRKKDEGMPPRKVQIPVAPWTPVQAKPVVEQVYVEEIAAEETIPEEEPEDSESV